MLDAYGFPSGASGADVQIFSSLDGWQHWDKPRGKTMIYIWAVACGGAGGNGFTKASGSAGGGGGGGGAGSIMSCLIPALFVPDRLFVYCGAPVSSGVGSPARVSLNPGVNTADCIVETTGGFGGTNGTGSGAAAGGSAATDTAVPSLSFFGINSNSPGNAGSAGGTAAGAVGSNVAFSYPTSGGAGGASCTSTGFAGGNITGGGIQPALPGGTTAIPAGNAGCSIVDNRRGMIFSGGSGGASVPAGVGGKGGDGGIGCGGGGGGSGTTGGAGGKGGPAMVIIVSW